MSAAGFILAINLFVAGIFAAAFGLLAAYSKWQMGARWLALAYALGIANAGLEFLLPMQADTKPMEILVFAVSLAAFIVVVIGLAAHYALPIPWFLLAGFFVAAIIANVLTLPLPYTSMLRNVVYQTPYALAHVIAAWMVARYRHKGALEAVLLVFLVLSGLQFVAKPIMADFLGATGPRGYLHSLYGAFSQMMTAFLLIADGILMLMIMMRDVMAEITTRSETDKLSGLLNRRGFEDRAQRLLVPQRRGTGPLSLVVSDLDHFKQVNDSFGHEQGDRVIEAYALTLRQASGPGAIVARLGGEEFVMLLPGCDTEQARSHAEDARLALANLAIPGLPEGQRVTASFGVARFHPGDSLSDLLRRADSALYEAKKAGRNMVCISQDVPAPPEPETPIARRRGSRGRA